MLERRQRQRAHVEDQIRDDKDTSLSTLLFKDFAMNRVWLELVLIAHNLLAWSKALVLTGELAKAAPKRLRHGLLHVAGRLAFHGRRARLRPQRDWPSAGELAAAFAKLEALPPPRRLTPQSAAAIRIASPARRALRSVPENLAARLDRTTIEAERRFRTVCPRVRRTRCGRCPVVAPAEWPPPQLAPRPRV